MVDYQEMLVEYQLKEGDGWLVNEMEPRSPSPAPISPGTSKSLNKNGIYD